MGELNARILFIIGTEELSDKQRVSKYFQQHSDAQIVEIPGADHMLTLTHPMELCNYIQDFMEEGISHARTSEENERIRQLAKENIRTTAMELFMKQGYYATSISDVAKQAGISKGLLYNYIKGKEELLATMVSRQELRN